MIDAAIAFYVDSLPSAPLPMTPLGSSQKIRPQQVSVTTTCTTSGSVPIAGSAPPGSQSMTPMSTRAGANEDMFFPADNFGEGVLSPVANATPRGSGRGFHGFGLQLPPTPQGHPVYSNSRSATPLTSPRHHFFKSEPTLLSSDGVDPAPTGTDALATAAAAVVSLADGAAISNNNSGEISPSALSTNACVPHKPTSQATAKCYQGDDMETMMDAEPPEFSAIVNYPNYVVQPGRKRKRVKKGAKKSETADIPSDKRCCVMCGFACPKSGSRFADENRRGSNSHHAIIPSQNKGLCTSCDVTVWVHVKTSMQIKWCKGCKNFKPWAGFGHKGHLTKCMRCRDEQNARYARQKELAAARKRARACAHEQEE